MPPAAAGDRLMPVERARRLLGLRSERRACRPPRTTCRAGINNAGRAVSQDDQVSDHITVHCHKVMTARGNTRRICGLQLYATPGAMFAPKVVLGYRRPGDGKVTTSHHEGITERAA